MAKSRRKRQLEIREKKEAKKIFTVVIIATLVLMAILFALFQWS